MTFQTTVKLAHVLTYKLARVAARAGVSMDRKENLREIKVPVHTTWGHITLFECVPHLLSFFFFVRPGQPRITQEARDAVPDGSIKTNR